MEPQSNVVTDSNVALGNKIIAQILGLFLRCNPQAEAVSLPDFRLKQLCECASSLGNGVRIVDADIIEGIGSLYAIGFYFSFTNDLERIPLKTLAKCAAILETVMTECLFTMQLANHVYVTHSDDIVQDIKRIATVKHFRLLAFLTASDLSKEILRDFIRQIRSCRDKHNIKAKKAAIATDCMKPHSIYFACAFGLSHLAAVLNHNNMLHSIPGLYESLLLFIHIDTQKRARYQLSERDEKKLLVSGDYRFHKCMDTSIQLAYSVVKTINAAYIQQVIIVEIFIIALLSFSALFSTL